MLKEYEMESKFNVLHLATTFESPLAILASVAFALVEAESHIDLPMYYTLIKVPTFLNIRWNKIGGYHVKSYSVPLQLVDGES